jgi:hypothetical protein
MLDFERTKELFLNESAILVHWWPVSLVIRYRPFSVSVLDVIPHHIENKITTFRNLSQRGAKWRQFPKTCGTSGLG